ncbi:hypothetical protein Amir_3156 [Actinosynnema mirum DSM 43827]|uniref:Double-GTPase 2 domain-containing protein n=2 Tax=Actinosynnema mirum TaxID=40567 RepID=C6W846_ACTMD|nr:hypothetical protein Amir_3156 [Actinosynnema mirum DSM 43827]
MTESLQAYVIPVASLLSISYLATLLKQRRNRKQAIMSHRTVQVMLLGLPESGKTVLFAAVYRALAYGGRDQVVLKADDNTAPHVLELTTALEQPGVELPPSNQLGTSVDLDFTFVVKDADGTTRDVCGLSFLDYAGEHANRLLHPGEAEPSKEVLESLDRADVLMGVLDGKRVLEVMKNGKDPKFFPELSELILLLTHAPQKVVHLVITKWDLIAELHTLAEVVERLNRFPPFQQFRDQCGGVLRIIPVSAFGMNGYLSHDVDGKALKAEERGLHWEPFNAATPFAHALRDVLEANVERLRANQEKASAGDYPAFFLSVGALLGMITISFPLLPGGEVQVELRPGQGGGDSPHRTADRERQDLDKVVRYLRRLSDDGVSKNLKHRERP